MPRAQIGGKQIRDDSVEGVDIKDGTIELVDLHPDLQLMLGGTAEPGGTGIIDPFHQYAEKSIIESTTSLTWQTYLTATTVDLPAGNYRIASSCQYRLSRNSKECAIRIMANGVELSSINKAMSTGDTEHEVYADFAEVAMSGISSIEVQYRRTAAQFVEISIMRAKLELRRVSLNG